MQMKRAYISVSKAKRRSLEGALKAIREAVLLFQMEPFVFVDAYQFDDSQQRAMMQQAMDDIDGCAILLAETSDKGIGIGIEAGYAKGRGKSVIYLRQEEAEHSSTLAGLSDAQIIYMGSADLYRQLTVVLGNLLSTGWETEPSTIETSTQASPDKTG